MKISLEEVEQCFAILIKMLRSRGVAGIDTSGRDYYWCVLSGDWLEFEDEAKISVGSLEDDLLELQKLTTEDAFPTAVDLERFAAVFRLLAEDFFDPPERE